MPHTQHELTTHLPSRKTAVRVEPYSAHVGATVHGIDLSTPLPAATRDALRHALFDHGVLFFRDQNLTPNLFLDATRIFGEPLRHNPYLPSHEDFSGVEIIESGVGRRLANESWHADVTWQHNPPFATALHAAELPPFGGDTVWASSTAAYDSLDPLLRAYLETLTASNFVDANGYSRTHEDEEGLRILAELRAKYPPIDVPVIATHPENGKKSIFVNELHTSYIKGVTRAVSESLLRILLTTLENPVFQARFTWRPGSVAVWDNRLVQHRAIHDYGDQRRVLHRVTLA
ncbi:MAG TPA: TauD/TfdA family dioxygenase [Polyangiales bacterium]|nr:TauD/TfdA family dioxygenase [Polyangiales bacterium]